MRVQSQMRHQAFRNFISCLSISSLTTSSQPSGFAPFTVRCSAQISFPSLCAEIGTATKLQKLPLDFARETAARDLRARVA